MNLFKRVNCSNLLTLDISYSNIEKLTNQMFIYLKKLKALKLIKTQLKFIDKYFSTNLPNVRELYLNKTQIPLHSSAAFLKELKHLKKIFTEQFQICCIMEKTDIEYDVCLPQPTVFITCDNIIPNKPVRYLLWMYWILGLFGNIFTFIIVIKQEKQTTRWFRLCLTFSDLMAILYLFVICIADMILEGTEYLIYQNTWRYGMYCKLLGILMSFSIMFSMSSIMGISYERFLAIVYPLKKNRMKNHTKLYILISFLFSVIVGVFPSIFYQVKIFIYI